MFASNVCRQLCRLGGQMHVTRRFLNNVYEPDYLASMVPEIPIYENLNIQLKGYDFPVLEAYQKHIHRLADVMEIDVDECWATPPEKWQIQRFKPKSSAVDSEYVLNIYERNIKICDVPSTTYSSLLRVIQETVPEGVSITVHQSLPEHQEIRYVPDNKLLELKNQLTEMTGPMKDRKKKK